MAWLLEKLRLLIKERPRAPLGHAPRCDKVTREEMMQIFKNELRFSHPSCGQ